MVAVDITYSADVLDLDAPAYEAAAERPDKPLRLRVQPTLLRQRAGDASGGNHQAWPGVSWTVECRDAEEAIAVRDALRAFFGALGAYGPAAVQKALTVPAPVHS